MQPNQPSDPRKEVVTEQKRALAVFVLVRGGMPHLSALLLSGCNIYTLLINYSS